MAYTSDPVITGYTTGAASATSYDFLGGANCLIAIVAAAWDVGLQIGIDWSPDGGTTWHNLPTHLADAANYVALGPLPKGKYRMELRGGAFAASSVSLYLQRIS